MSEVSVSLKFGGVVRFSSFDCEHTIEGEVDYESFRAEFLRVAEHHEAARLKEQEAKADRTIDALNAEIKRLEQEREALRDALRK